MRSDELPSQIWLTWLHWSLVPSIVQDDFRRFAPNYKLRFFSDNDCPKFVLDNCGPEAARRYRALQTPAHRADLWRYCALWSQGGIYLDIKTWLVQPLSTIFAMNNTGYTVLSVLSGQRPSVYQGVIASPKGDPTIQKMLVRIVKERTVAEMNANYLQATEDAYHIISSDVGKSIRGGSYMTSLGRQWIIFEERQRMPCSTPDRYGICTDIVSDLPLYGKTLFHTRHPTFPAAFLHKDKPKTNSIGRGFQCQDNMVTQSKCMQTETCPLRHFSFEACRKRCLRTFHCSEFIHNAYAECFLFFGNIGVVHPDKVAHGTTLCQKTKKT